MIPDNNPGCRIFRQWLFINLILMGFMALSAAAEDSVTLAESARPVVDRLGLVEAPAPVRERADWRQPERIVVRGVEEKRGGKGEYLAVDFEVLLSDAAGGEVASDLHQFFLRV